MLYQNAEMEPAVQGENNVPSLLLIESIHQVSMTDSNSAYLYQMLNRVIRP